MGSPSMTVEYCCISMPRLFVFWRRVPTSLTTIALILSMKQMDLLWLMVYAIAHAREIVQKCAAQVGG